MSTNFHDFFSMFVYFKIIENHKSDFLSKMPIHTIVAEVAIWLTPQVPSPL